MAASLSAMIGEVEREIKTRGEVYGRLVSRGKMRESEKEYRIGLMKDVQATLVWLADIDRRALEDFLARRGKA